MESTQHLAPVDRKTLVQINATIIAGMMIFLTLENPTENFAILSITNITMFVGFIGLILSIMICFVTRKKVNLFQMMN